MPLNPYADSPGMSGTEVTAYVAFMRTYFEQAEPSLSTALLRVLDVHEPLYYENAPSETAWCYGCQQDGGYPQGHEPCETKVALSLACDELPEWNPAWSRILTPNGWLQAAQRVVCRDCDVERWVRGIRLDVAATEWPPIAWCDLSCGHVYMAMLNTKRRKRYVHFK